MKSRARGFESHPLRGRAARSGDRLGAAFALAAACGAGGATLQPVGGATLTAATWNIPWLGDGHRDEALAGNQRGGRHLRGPDDLDRLRGIVRTLVERGVEVVGLQEIENAAAARRLFPQDEWELFVSRRETEPRWAQHTAVVVRRSAGWRVERHPDLVEWSPQGRDRHGVDLELSRGGVRVRFLTLHFQSGCFDRSLDSGRRECGFLRMQFAVLKGWLHDRREEGVPVVVAGDWNRWLAQLDDDTLGRLPGDPLLVPPKGSVPECWGGRFDSFVDYLVAFPPPGGKAAVRDFEEVRYEAPAELRNRLSDHCPVVGVIAFR